MRDCTQNLEKYGMPLAEHKNLEEKLTPQGETIQYTILTFYTIRSGKRIKTGINDQSGIRGDDSEEE